MTFARFRNGSSIVKGARKNHRLKPVLLKKRTLTLGDGKSAAGFFAAL